MKTVPLSSQNLLLWSSVFCSTHARGCTPVWALGPSSLAVELPQCYHTRAVKGTGLLQKHRGKRGATAGCCPNPLLAPGSPQDPFAGLATENLPAVMSPSQGELQLTPKSTNTAKDQGHSIAAQKAGRLCFLPARQDRAGGG